LSTLGPARKEEKLRKMFSLLPDRTSDNSQKILSKFWENRKNGKKEKNIFFSENFFLTSFDIFSRNLSNSTDRWKNVKKSKEE